MKYWPWISDCGKYLAVKNKDSNCWSQCDVISVDGSTRWIGGGHRDALSNRALPHQTIGWSALPNATFKEYRKGCFTVSFADCDPDIELIPWSGNTIKQKYEAVFRKRVRPSTVKAAAELIEQGGKQ